MGNFVSRQNAAVEEADQTNTNHAYKYPPRMGNFFGSHFIMGGERFDTPQPESYLFGENADLNFLGNRPTAFPYPPPQANEPTKTLKSLVNIRKESVRFVRVPVEKKAHELEEKPEKKATNVTIEEIDGNVLCSLSGSGSGGDVDVTTTITPPPPPPCSYNIEFTFDSDAKCAITIYYFCSEDVSPSGVTLVPRDGLTSETYHYEKGINQSFSQPGHLFNPQLIPEDDLIYNPGKEQYPVAIHCVVEEGNEECRQSHTTICVIDHHPESNSYVLRALKQKIFVDGLCYLLQEIYGIENKAVNKASSMDEEIDDHGSECVICMSETRDTLILPCRHLCLCNSCADSLRYQANNCPICRAPFRALLQIRAVQKGILSTSNTGHILTSSGGGGATTGGTGSGSGDPAPVDVPPGYIPVSLIEALNGPPQYIARPRTSDHDLTDSVGTMTTGGNGSAVGDHKTTASSPLKSGSQRRTKSKKNASTCTSTNEVGTLTTSLSNSLAASATLSVVEIESDPKKSTTATCTSPTLTGGTDKLKIVNERGSKYGRGSGTDDDVDSENEKLSPLLSSSSPNGHKPKTQSNKTLKQVVATLEADDAEGGKTAVEGGGGSGGAAASTTSDNNEERKTERSTKEDDSEDYYTPEDTQNSILSPLCPTEKERAKSGDPLCGVSNLNPQQANRVVVGFSCSSVKKNLHKKSTSVGNMNSNLNSSTTVVDLKSNNGVSSLPDMLDSPIGSGNSASTRSSSDSYSSSSSTKQLLSSNPTSTAANIIVDDKTALQNAVNV
ncbi:E3 ubiquitin-protein ligase MGRN1 [Drosophila tropicalis]|uniref:E3 ubiquitin-protein ligase MGRN1 n=1 Tax=Drosophila tropicalis TaxID=46794 RepID=UPI0035ABF25A